MQPHSPQKSFTDHSRRNRSFSSPEKRVITIFQISVSSVFKKYCKNLWRVSKECHQSKLISARHFSSNGILLHLGKAEMKIYKRPFNSRVLSRTPLRLPWMESLPADYSKSKSVYMKKVVTRPQVNRLWLVHGHVSQFKMSHYPDKKRQ